MASNPAGTVRVTHRFNNVPAERVFDAWLDVKNAGRWLFATPTGTMVRVEIDPRVGGRFLFVDRRNGEDIEHVGEYSRVERARRLAFTFNVPKFSPLMTEVNIDVEPYGASGCALTLTHEGVLPGYLEKTREGWGMILRRLETEVSLGAVRMSRRLDFPPERVFDAWIDPAVASKWLLTTAGSEHHDTQLDARVGGYWSITDRRGGVDYKAIGEYLELKRPRRLVFTFGMPQFSDKFALVIVEIAASGTGSVLSLAQERVPWEHVSGIEQGWSEMLEQLREALTLALRAGDPSLDRLGRP